MDTVSNVPLTSYSFIAVGPAAVREMVDDLDLEVRKGLDDLDPQVGEIGDELDPAVEDLALECAGPEVDGGIPGESRPEQHEEGDQDSHGDTGQSTEV